jgi:hypothetical protein
MKSPLLTELVRKVDVSPTVQQISQVQADSRHFQLPLVIASKTTGEEAAAAHSTSASRYANGAWPGFAIVQETIRAFS